MTVHKSNKVRRALNKKGFTSADNHDEFFFYYYKGQRTSVFTRISHGSNHDIGEYLISEMKKQLHLDKDQFNNLVNCPLSKEDLEALYLQKGIIKVPKLSV